MVAGNGEKEIAAPEIQRTGILDKRKRVVFCLFKIDRRKSFIEEAEQCCNRQGRIAVPVVGLAHPLLKVNQIDRDIPRQIPQIIVKIATFDPLFSVSAQQGMHFSRKQRRLVVQPDRMRHRPQFVLDFVPGACRRIGVDFHFDFKLLVFRNSGHRRTGGGYANKLE